MVAARLSEAVQIDGRPLRELAQTIRRQHRLSYSWQNLHHLTRRGVRCRASLRKAFALVLNAPEDYLGGRNELPYVPASFWETPSANALRYSALMIRVAGALRRDLGRWLGKDEARRAYDTWGQAMLDVFDALSDQSVWRHAAVIPTRSPVDDPGVMLPTDNTASIAWLTQMLEPWIEGTAYLHATGIDELFRGLLANPHGTGQPRSYASGLRALQKYAALCKKFARPRITELAAIAKLGRAVHPTDERAE